MNIKKQFSEMRKNTPKHIQWLLLAAAFVVVIILLTLLLTNHEEEVLESNGDVAITLGIVPDTIEWPDVSVGDTKTETIKVTASAPIKIVGVNLEHDIPGLKQPIQQTCTSMGQIDADNACTIVLEYSPIAASDVTTTELYIEWHDANASESMKNTGRAILVVGANDPAPVVEPEPIIEPEPLVIPDPEPIIEPEPVVAPEPVVVPTPTIKQEIKSELAEIIPTNDFVFDDEPTVTTMTDTGANTTAPVPSEACSDFAMPGYNLSGVQSGWIRPSGGAYYFHPFSDTECKNPTGTYNPDNGIITDINNPAQKIGTDAEHIGYTTITNGTLPQLSNPATTRNENKAVQLTAAEINALPQLSSAGQMKHVELKAAPKAQVIVGTSGSATYSSDPYDRSFVLRQYKPIPATIVSEVRADPTIYESGHALPVQATVDRNVYSDDGRTIVIPTGTLMLGYVNGELPGPYKSIGRMNINWYQFILPNGVEFNFTGDPNQDPFSADSQGRVGVPGHGSTDYVEQLVMPMLTAIVPAAVNMIAPISDAFINQIDLDNNTVVQSGTIRSSELAKNEIITAWNQVAQKLLVDAMDNTIPPFSIAAGTRITVYSPTDLVITCGHDVDKICSVENLQQTTQLRPNWRHSVTVNPNDGSWTGQVRSFNLEQYCTTNSDGIWDIKPGVEGEIINSGYDYRTVLAYCQSLNYQAINNARQDAVYQNQQEQFKANYSADSSFNTGTGLSGISGSQAYNEDILGLTYDDSGAIQNPFVESDALTDVTETTETVITCDGGVAPDEYGCCPGEIYTDMGEQGFNCCPETGGDCFPPIL